MTDMNIIDNKLIATIVKHDNDTMWYVWCTQCQKKIDEDIHAKDITITGKRHTLRTGHTTIVGCMIVLTQREKENDKQVIRQ